MTERKEERALAEGDYKHEKEHIAREGHEEIKEVKRCSCQRAPSAWAARTPRQPREPKPHPNKATNYDALLMKRRTMPCPAASSKSQYSIGAPSVLSKLSRPCRDVAPAAGGCLPLTIASAQPTLSSRQH